MLERSPSGAEPEGSEKWEEPEKRKELDSAVEPECSIG